MWPVFHRGQQSTCRKKQRFTWNREARHMTGSPEMEKKAAVKEEHCSRSDSMQRAGKLLEPLRAHWNGRMRRENKTGGTSTHPGAAARARLRRPRESSRRRAARTAAITLLCKGLLPLHMYGYTSTKRRESIWVTPRSSTCALHRRRRVARG